LLKVFAVLLGLAILSAAAIWALEGVTEFSCVSVLHIDGPIALGSFGPGTSDSRAIAQQIEDFDAGTSPVLLLEINSPGGSAVASAEIYEALRATNKTKVAYLSEMAASGGYYSAAGTDYIVANPNTITGSIGAVTGLFNYEELLQKIGLRQDAIKSGELKDIGAPYRNMTEEERQLLQDLIDETAARFVADVRAGRSGKLTAAFETVLDARILSAQAAKDAGLVDQLGSRKAALQKAAELGGLGTETPSECDITPAQPAFSDLFYDIGASLGQGFINGVQAQGQRSQVRT